MSLLFLPSIDHHHYRTSANSLSNLVSFLPEIPLSLEDEDRTPAPAASMASGQSSKTRRRCSVEDIYSM